MTSRTFLFAAALAASALSAPAFAQGIGVGLGGGAGVGLGGPPGHSVRGDTALRGGLGAQVQLPAARVDARTAVGVETRTDARAHSQAEGHAAGQSRVRATKPLSGGYREHPPSYDAGARSHGQATAASARSHRLLTTLRAGMPVLGVDGRVLGRIEGFEHGRDGRTHALRVRTAAGVRTAALERFDLAANGRAAVALNGALGR